MIPFNIFSIGRKKERSVDIPTTTVVSPTTSDGNTAKVVPVRKSEILIMCF